MGEVVDVMALLLPQLLNGFGKCAALSEGGGESASGNVAAELFQTGP